MKNKNILITWKIMRDYIYKNSLNKKKNIKFDFLCKDQSLTKKDLLPIIHKYDGVICGDDDFDKSVIDRAKKLRVISKWGTGIDSIDKAYCQKKGIKVYNTPGAFTNGVSQYAFALVLAFTRSLFEIDKHVRKGYWPKPAGFLMENKNIGIIGMGKIGKRIAFLCQKVGFNIFFYDIKKIKSKYKQKNKNFVLGNSDILVLSCDLNKTSYKLIKYKDLKKMKKTSAIINIARGPIIDEASLIKVLEKKMIKFAGLDVFEKEPIKLNNKLLNLNNCFIGSHNAFNTIEEVEKVNKVTFTNLLKFL